MHPHLDTILFHETTILSRLDVLAAQLMSDYVGKELSVVLVLHGGLFFAADLLRRLHLPLRIHSLEVSSYHGTASSGSVTFKQSTLPEVQGRHVLLIDDILDTGRTLSVIRQRLLDECAPASLRTCVLLKKRRAREVEVQADYVGFEIDDEFVVGYGLDYEGEYRNLPLIGTLKREFIHMGA